jgi:hypothetical protein
MYQKKNFEIEGLNILFNNLFNLFIILFKLYNFQ